MRRLVRLSVLLCCVTIAAHADLVGYWTFDGTNTQDSSGNNYHGTMVGGSYTNDVPTALSGGMAIDLSQGNHYVKIDQGVDVGGGSPEFDHATNITVSCWIKGWPGGSWATFVSKYGEGANGWQLRRHSNKS